MLLIIDIKLKDETFYLFLPRPIFPDLNNNQSVTFEKVKTDAPVSCQPQGNTEDITVCDGYPCIKYECTIEVSQNAPLIDGTSIIVRVNFQFDATNTFLEDLKKQGVTKENSDMISTIKIRSFI